MEENILESYTSALKSEMEEKYDFFSEKKEPFLIDNMTYKEFFKDRTRLYFKPLKEKWFYLYAMPIIAIGSVILSILEHN